MLPAVGAEPGGSGSVGLGGRRGCAPPSALPPPACCTHAHLCAWFHHKLPAPQFVPNESFFPTTNETMFWEQPAWSRAPMDAFCAQQFGAGGPQPNYGLLPLLYSAGDLSAASNLILSNGELDPWSSGAGWLLSKAGRAAGWLGGCLAAAFV